MATTDIDITALVAEAKAAADAIVAAQPRGRTKCGRSCDDLAAELSYTVDLVPDAVAEASAFIDIAAREPLTEEIQDCAALGAAALFLGRRLMESNISEITALHPELGERLEPVAQIAVLLDELSKGLLRTVRQTNYGVHRAA